MAGILVWIGSGVGASTNSTLIGALGGGDGVMMGSPSGLTFLCLPPFFAIKSPVRKGPGNEQRSPVPGKGGT